MSASATISISDVTVMFGNDHRAVNAANLEVGDGEFFTLLGPSGCGKTTLLRTLAGFIRQTAGSIRIGGQAVDHFPPHQRDTAMVFQNYAIFPHLTVAQNVAYGLKSRGLHGDEARARVRETLHMVDLEGYEDRLPRSMSGGQQQRVVIARAIATRPRVLLMDEPLANLDAKLRNRLRLDIRRLQQELGITTIYVTHDQDEALSLSDRIGVMSRGDLLQVGTPHEIFRAPATVAVAKFVGEGNFFVAKAAGSEAILENGSRIPVAGLEAASGKVEIGFRPHNVRLVGHGSVDAVFSGSVAETIYLGTLTRCEVDCGLGQRVQVDIGEGGAVPEVGSSVGLAVGPDAIMSFAHDDVDAEL
ncbi:ABC transporter ATP-binding protein [Microbacterium sp.]|uniref:ABC transporter ATP-binding protein n=1 Tax=Microbacterium sp. TaxID=51671 RepID=UPI002811121A|nr:ABC transporter ATP-binding protein [Microbacterium sp.]